MSTESGRRLGRRRGERGAALLEFALIFPIFMMVVLGMFSGGREYNRKSAMVSATREGSRYGATFPVASSTAGTITSWLHDLALYVENASEGSLSPGVPGREICVAYVYTPTSGPDETRRERHLLGNTGSVAQTGKCFEDGRPPTERRVQVSTRRGGEIEGLFFSIPITLSTETVTRFEAVP